jgi:hypothetical protein
MRSVAGSLVGIIEVERAARAAGAVKEGDLSANFETVEIPAFVAPAGSEKSVAHALPGQPAEPAPQSSWRENGLVATARALAARFRRAPSAADREAALAPRLERFQHRRPDVGSPAEESSTCPG